MRKRGSGRIVAATIVAIGALAIAAWVGWRKSTNAAADWSRITTLLPSSLANLPSSLQSPPSAPADAAGPAPDAGVIVHRQAAPLSKAQLGAPLVHGKFLSTCGAPDDMKVVVHLDVKMGHATKVTVKTQPPNPTVASCVERAVRDLEWDMSPQVGHVTVTY
jgi:hypothetical protein